MSSKDPELSNGVLLKLVDGQFTYEELVLQVLCLRCIHEEMLFRVTLNDSVFSTTFAFIQGDLLEDLKLAEHSIMKIKKYQLRQISIEDETRFVIWIQSAKLLAHKFHVIGDPENIDVQLGPSHDVKENLNAVMNTTQISKSQPQPAIKTEPCSSQIPATQPPPKQKCPFPEKLVKVTSLGVTVKMWKEWVIKVRVVNKLPIKIIFGGTGKMAVWDFSDDSGIIRAAAFDKNCDKFAAFQLNKVYWIQGAMIRVCKEPKKELHRFELKLESWTKVRECVDDTKVPSMMFNFTPLNTINNVGVSSAIDIIGVVSRAMPLRPKNVDRLSQRRVMLVSPDTGMFEVDLDLWGTYAEDLDPSTNPVIVVKNCRCSAYASSAKLFLDSISVFMTDPPDIPEVAKLKEWYAEQCKDTHFIPQIEPSQVEVCAESFAEARKKVLTSQIKVVTAKCRATVLDVDSQYLVNLCCSACRCKVHDLNLIKLVCYKCGFVDGAIMKNLLTKIRLGDTTSSEWVTVGDSECRKLLNISSSFVESHSIVTWQTLQKLKGQQFDVHLKFDRNQGSKIPCQVLSMEPIPESIYF